jgi:hypothetical protein
MTTKPENVYAKIAAVQGDLAHTGIGKESENTFDRYKFRGIDAVYNALAPLLAKHRLCILPRIIERDCQERVSRKGEPMFYITVTAEFDFVSADDGSVHVVRTYGEAMDRSDKATNKAMSAAYKYAAFMAFAIPTEGDNDADAATPDAGQRVDAPPVEKPARGSQHSALRTKYREFVHELNGCGDGPELSAFLATIDSLKLVQEIKDKLPHIWDGENWPETAERPEEFVPLCDLISRRERECAQRTVDQFGA